MPVVSQSLLVSFCACWLYYIGNEARCSPFRQTSDNFNLAILHLEPAPQSGRLDRIDDGAQARIARRHALSDIVG